MRIPIILSLLLVVPIVIVGGASRALVTTQTPVAARQLKVDGALAQTKVECTSGEAAIARMGKLLTPWWEHAPKSAPPVNHPELRRPLRRVRMAWDTVVNWAKRVWGSSGALELFSADLNKHTPRELGITQEELRRHQRRHRPVARQRRRRRECHRNEQGQRKHWRGREGESARVMIRTLPACCER